MSFESELYPFSSHWFDTGRGRMHYVDEGPEDAPVLLMLHGNPTWSFYYRELIREFAGEYRVIAPDHIGMGLSDKPQDFDYTLKNHIDNIAALVEDLDLSDITLVVHDWGGAIGMGAAVRAPERYRRFVVFNTAAFLVDRMPFLLSLARASGIGALAVRGFGAFGKVALMTCVHHKERLSPQVRAGYLAPYDNWKNRIANLRFVEDIPLKPDDPAYGVVEGIDEALSVFADRPMLIVWGAKDFVFNDIFFEEWKKRFPNAETHYVEDAGHYVVEDAHERITGWMRGFLETR